MPFQPGDRVVITRINYERVNREQPLLPAAIGQIGTVVRGSSTESEGYYVRIDGRDTVVYAYEEELERA